MKGLFTFVKNNRIIYKVSIVSVLILMLISVVQINPDDMNINKQDGFPTVTEELEYTLVYNNGNFYKTSVNESNKISTSDYPRGFSIRTVSQVEQDYSISINRELMDGVENVIVMDGVDIATTSRWTTLSLEEDVYIYLKGNNKITSKYEDTGTIKWYSGIDSNGNISFIGDGSLNVTYSDESSGINRYTAIQSYNNIYIQGVNIVTKGSYCGICAEETVRIDSGKVKAVAINCNYDTTGIKGKNSVEINGGEVSVVSNSSKTWASGISTGKNGKGDSIKITGGKVDISVSNPNPNSISKGIDSGKITLSGGETNIKINGNKCTGIGAIGSTSGNGLYISDNAKISVDGNVTGASYGINSSSNMLDIKGGNISIKLRNAINDNKVIGIRLYSSRMSMSSGNLDVSVDVYRENDKKYGIADGIYAIDSSSNIEVSGGNLRVKTNGRSSSNGVNAEGNVTISGGSIEARNTNKTEQGYGINVSGMLSITGGHLTAQGNNRAVNLKGIEPISMGSNVEKDYSVSVIAASTDFDGKTLGDYDGNQIPNYKYIEIGSIYNYSLKYNASSGTLHKVSTDSESLTDANKIDSSELPGWEVVNKAGKKVLVLKGLSFMTSKSKALEINGEATIRVEDGTTNCIGAVDTNDNIDKKYAIHSLGNLTIEGNGKLSVVVNGGKDGVGIGIGSWYEDVETGEEIDNRGNIIINNANICINGGGSQESIYGFDICGTFNFSNASIKIDLVNNNGNGTAYGIGTKGTGEEELLINDSDINIKIEANNLVYGMFLTKKLVVSDNSNLKFELSGKSVDGVFSYKDCVINTGEIDMNLQVQTSGRGIYCGMMEVNGGNSSFTLNGVTSNSATSGVIECRSSYIQNAGRVYINSDKKIGIYVTPSAEFIINDGTVEITAGSQVIETDGQDKTKIKNENVSISEYIEQSDGTKKLKYTGADVTNIPSYSHVIIEPNYFLKYSGDKLYKCTNTSDAGTLVDSYPGVSIDTTSHAITLDGFVFTTSLRRGLYIADDNVTINLADGSTNIIDTKLSLAVTKGNFLADESGNYIGAAIYGRKPTLNIGGNGDLFLSNKLTSYEELPGVKGCHGIYAEYLNINGGNLVINIENKDSNNYQGKVVFCKNNLQITGGNIDGYIFSNFARGLSADGIVTLDEMYTGNISIKCKGTDIHTISGDNGVYIYGGNIKIENNQGENITSQPDVYGIYSNDQNTNNDIDSISIGKKDSSNKVNIEINNKHRGNSRVIYAHGHIMINNSAINIISNTNHGETAITEGDYGIYSSDQYLSIEDSDINIKAKLINNNEQYITGVCAIKNVNIKNTNVDINMDSKSCEGVLSRNNDINIDNSNISIKTVDNTINKISIRGIKSPEGNIIMTSSSTDIDIKGQNCEGILVEKGDMTINNCDTIKIKVLGITLNETYTDSYIKCMNIYKQLEITNSVIDANSNVTYSGDGIRVGADVANTHADYYNGVLNISSSTVKAYTDGDKSNGGINVLGDITLTNSNVDARNTNSSDANGKGIYGRNITVKRGKTIAKGNGGAIVTGNGGNLILSDNGDMVTKVIKYSKTFKESYAENDADIVEYTDSNEDLSKYKYLEIGEVANYYYRYSGGILYKVSNLGVADPLNETTWPIGCSVSNDGKLVLNGFNFVTTASKIIDIDGEANVNIKGNNTIRNVYSTSDNIYGIYSNGKITLTSIGGVLTANYVNHDYLNESEKCYTALHSEDNISIDGGSYNVNAQQVNFIGVDGKNISIRNAIVNVIGKVKYDGYGIYAVENILVSNSTVDAKGKTSAIGVKNGGKVNIKGKVDASADYNGTLVTVTDINDSYSNYKYISIIPSVISVDITWGNMDFTYTEGSWNPISHDYNVGTWKPTDGKKDSAKITVNNANSNVPIYAEIGYATKPGYEGISGKIVDVGNSEISNNVRVLKGNSFVAYLDLSNKLPSTTSSKIPIGTVTVTISE